MLRRSLTVKKSLLYTLIGSNLLLYSSPVAVYAEEQPATVQQNAEETKQNETEYTLEGIEITASRIHHKELATGMQPNAAPEVKPIRPF